MLVVVGLCRKKNLQGTGDLFLVQKRPEDPYQDLWEFPGGKREVGEKLAEALKREWQEELGVDISVHEIAAEAVINFPEKHDVLLPLFHVRIVRGDPKPLIGQELRWCTLEEVEQLPGVPSFDHYLPILRGRS